jgi:SAM-dependent methyltransferase
MDNLGRFFGGAVMGTTASQLTAEAQFFLEALGTSLNAAEFVKLTFTRYLGDEPNLHSLSIRLVEIKGATKLAFAYRYATQDIVKNFAIDEGLAVIQTLLDSFKSMRLFTTRCDLELAYNKRMQPRLVNHKSAFGETTTQTNDRPKKRYIEAANNRYLVSLGIANEAGQILKGRESKFKQINKFVEILDSLYRTSSLQTQTPISVVDMGSGKGYLTFATYDFLHHIEGKEVSVTGIEARPELVDRCNQIARSAHFQGLQFEPGVIQDAPDRPADITIALHACDTATDDAIYKGIKANSSLIILSPCCHKQIRREMERSANIKQTLQHGILIERQAEIVTDRLRSFILELHGYHTKVFEFIDSEHTSKNLMIAAVKHSGQINQAQIRTQMQQFKALYDVRSFYLENLLFPETALRPDLMERVCSNYGAIPPANEFYPLGTSL